jgi:iron complex transport system substrate-binding protein
VERADSLTSSLHARLNAVRVQAATLQHPKVFCMEWLDPPWTAGHWVPEMIEIAGGRDELGTWGGPSRRVEWREVVDYAPEVLTLMPCSLDLQRITVEFPLVRQLPAWSSLPAVRGGQVFAVNTQLFSRSGPRLVDGAETLARILHPEVFTIPLPAGQALKMAKDGVALVPLT